MQSLLEATGSLRRDAADAREWEEVKAGQQAYQAEVRRAAEQKPLEDCGLFTMEPRRERDGPMSHETYRSLENDGYRALPFTPARRPPAGRRRRADGGSEPGTLHDLANSLEPNNRLTVRVRRLGDPALAVPGRSGLGRIRSRTTPRHRQLQRRITTLEQQLADKRGALDERTEELDASRAANRELTRCLNQLG
ncbi:hypothetical protein ACFVYE_39185 [Streptomyces sp. NPDC058239]|uniref:hypothetical protein n=1 Tax=Streptomyces sp. NPDC058239 TaxID=3346395 RepID=UPI0036E47780